MEKINTAAVIREVSTKMGCYQKDVADLLTHFVNLIIENAKEGRAINIKGLGIFYQIPKRGNPRLKFRASKSAKNL